MRTKGVIDITKEELDKLADECLQIDDAFMYMCENDDIDYLYNLGFEHMTDEVVYLGDNIMGVFCSKRNKFFIFRKTNIRADINNKDDLRALLLKRVQLDFKKRMKNEKL